MKPANSTFAADYFDREKYTRISRRNWLGIGIWMSIQPKTYAAKPPLVLALDQTSLWYLGNAASQLITADSSQTTRTIASLNDDDVAIVVMDLACRSSQALLNQVTQRVKSRHAKVYGVGLAPFRFEGASRHSDGRHGWLQLHEQTDGYKVVRSEEAAERLGEDVTWEEAQGHLSEAVLRSVTNLASV